MNSGKYVFAQRQQFIYRCGFGKCAKRYNGEYRTRDFNGWNTFIQMFFGQLTSRNSRAAIYTYRVVAHVKHPLKSELSIYGIIQILGIPSMFRAPLQG